jgi:ketosteroid isomerase-like protein
MKTPSIVIALAIGMAAALAGRLTLAARDQVSEVMAIEQARIQALDSSDIPALERIMADDVTYVHASGKVDTKASYLAAIKSGQLHYISWTRKDLHVRMLGDAAVVNGEYAVRVTDSRVQASPLELSIFILSVYARRDGRWQQIAWQSTRDPAPSAGR